MKDLNDIVRANLCLGCGLCTLGAEKNKPVEMKYSKSKGHVVPFVDNASTENAELGFHICPGKGYRINTLAKDYNLGEYYNKDLGSYNSLSVVTTKDKKILSKASSSGIMTILLDFLIENKMIDKAIVTKFEYGSNGPNAAAFVADEFDQLIAAQGSKYCPVDFSQALKELKEAPKRSNYAVVGTPCQIASLRYIQNNVQDLGIKYFIGNFCGGFKSYNNLKRIIQLNKVQPNEVKYFRFRGGGQPGSMMIKTDDKVVTAPYPEYVKMTGYTKVKRCHFCVDATAELADFSCGDAWLPKYENSTNPTSIVIARTQQATEILKRIDDSNRIKCQPINADEVIESQIGNIKTKKHRQFARIKLYKFLRIKMPEIVEGFNKDVKTSLLLELNVFISHRTKFIFEKLGLYYFFYYKNSFFKRIITTFFRDIYN